MKPTLLLLLVVPFSAWAADNTMINAEIEALSFARPPAIGMSFQPAVEPGVVVSLPDGGITVIPGYRVSHSGIAYIVGISCEADMTDDCSAYPYSSDYRDRQVFIRYIQISDRKFRTPEGSGVGDRWGQTIQRAGSDPPTLSGNDSCVRLPSGWHACIDLMSTDRRFDTKLRRLLPKKSAIIDFFYQSSGAN